MSEQGLRITAETPALGIGMGQLIEGWQFGLLIQAFLQDRLDGPQGRRLEVQRPSAGGFQPPGAIGLGQAQQALHRPQLDQHSVGKQGPHQGQAVGAHILRPCQAPLGILQVPGQRLRRQMVHRGGTAARCKTPDVGGHQFMLTVEPHRIARGLEPQTLSRQPEGDGVITAFELHMGIPGHLHLGPYRQFRRNVRQRGQQGLLHFREDRQGRLAGGAVDAVAGFSHDPGLGLAVGIGQVPEGAQGQEVVFHVFAPRFHDALLLGIPGRTGVDLEAIAFGGFGIGALDFRFMDAGPGDGALGVVDDEAARNTIEPLQGMAVAGKPGDHALVTHEFHVLVAGMAQGHDEEQSLVDLTAAGIGEPS